MKTKTNNFKKILNIILFLFILPILIFIWAFYIEPNMLVVKHYSIINEKLAGIRIVFASDFHLKSSEEKKLERIVKKINKQEPDIVLLGGDFVNGHDFENTLEIDKIARGLSNIKSKYGICSVLGNHDWWLDGEGIKHNLKKENINVLLNENKVIKINSQDVFIAGTEDLITREPDIKKTLQNTTSPVILVTHSPDIFPQIPSSVDLTLAAHTHGGQVIIPFLGPLIVPSDYGSKYAVGLIEENNKKMIVSKGIGTSIISVRFNCAPEIIVIDFK